MTKELLVLPICQDRYIEKTNELELTMFLGFTRDDGQLTLLAPQKIPDGKSFSLTPIGLENFIPEELLERDKLFEIIRKSIQKEVKFANAFSDVPIESKEDFSEVTTFQYPMLGGDLSSYLVEQPKRFYYLSVIKVKVSLDSLSKYEELDFSYKIFNVSILNNLDVINTIEYPTGDIEDLPENYLNIEMKDLHDIGLQLQFLAFNDNAKKQIRTFIELFMLSKTTEKDLKSYKEYFENK